MMAQLIGVSLDARAEDTLPPSAIQEISFKENFASVMGRSYEAPAGSEADPLGALQVPRTQTVTITQSQAVSDPTYTGTNAPAAESGEPASTKALSFAAGIVDRMPGGNPRVSTPTVAKLLQPASRVEQLPGVIVNARSATTTGIQAASSIPFGASTQSTVMSSIAPVPLDGSSAANALHDQSFVPVDSTIAGLDRGRENLTPQTERSTWTALPQMLPAQVSAMTSSMKSHQNPTVSAKKELLPKAAKDSTILLLSRTLTSTDACITSGLPPMPAAAVTLQGSVSAKVTNSGLSSTMAKSPGGTVAGSRNSEVQGPSRSNADHPDAVLPNSASVIEPACVSASGRHDTAALLSEPTQPGILAGAATEISASMPIAHTPGLSTTSIVVQGSVQGTGNSHAMGLVAESTPAIEAAGASLTPSVLHATPTSLEVGVVTGTHGWLKIRAELTARGEVAASLSGGSASAASGLRSELPALTSYLAGEKVTVSSLAVVVASPLAKLNGSTDTSSSAGGGVGPGQMGGAPNGQREGEAEQRAPTQVWDREDNGGRGIVLAASARYGSETGLGGEVSASPVGYGSGGWLNVRV